LLEPGSTTGQEPDFRAVRQSTLFFDQKGYGPQRITDVLPSQSAGSEAILKRGGVPRAGSSYFYTIGSGGQSVPKSKCQPVVSPYASQYSKLRVTAELEQTADSAPTFFRRAGFRPPLAGSGSR
jgi:hypothetical protein